MESGSRRIIFFRLQNSHCGIIKPSLSLLKHSMVFLKQFLGKPADKNFLVMPFTSQLMSLAIRLNLCNSPVMTLRLYLVGILEDQCTGSFFDLS